MGKLEKSTQHSHHPSNVNKPTIDNNHKIFSIEQEQLAVHHPDHDDNFKRYYTELNNLKTDVGRYSAETVNSFETVVVAPNQEQMSEKYCKKLHRNRRQTGSICAGLLLMFVSGLHIGWGIWRTHGWPISTNPSLLIFSIMAWPLGAIFGSFIGSAIVVVLKKNLIYLLTAAIMIIGNVLHIIWDEQYAAIVVGRLLTSLAHGMVFIVLIIQAGENASRNMRGTIISAINCLLYTAIFVSVHVIATLDVAGSNVVTAERIIGSIALAFILGSIVCTLTVHVETVPHLLWKNEPLIAMENMKRLRDVAIETPQMTMEMAETEAMVRQDQQDNRTNVFVNGNGKPLLLIVSIRLMAALTDNLLLNIVMIGSCEMVLYHYKYAPLMIVAPRLAMSTIQVFYGDVFGRKIQLIVSATLTGLTLIGFGVALNVLTITDSMSYYVPSLFCMWFQLFCGVGIQQMSDVYLAEAFSTAKKPWSLSFVMGIEHTFQIFMTGMAFTTINLTGLNALLFATGIFIVVGGVVLVFVLPETKGMTLKAARDAFRSDKIFHLL